MGFFHELILSLCCPNSSSSSGSFLADPLMLGNSDGLCPRPSSWRGLMLKLRFLLPYLAMWLLRSVLKSRGPALAKISYLAAERIDFAVVNSGISGIIAERY